MRKRGKFSLSNTKLFSCDMGELVPCGLTEVLPGDSIQQATSLLVRASPLLAPVMHKIDCRIHHWFVPNRIIWEDWEKFITGGPDGLDASVFPTITFASGVAVGTLGDYLGLPTGVNGISVSALPFRAYAKIFNEWYRDQDLVTALTIDETSGPDTTTNTTLQNCAWEKDYFTSARPWETKGAAITTPIGGEANVLGIGLDNTSAPGSASALTARETGDSPGTEAYTGWGVKDITGGANTAGQAKLLIEQGATGYPYIRADLTSATGVSINDLREALALQRFQEARARYGSRYSEYLLHLGVRSSDSRLQRPEYLGGGRENIQFSEVLQTAEGTNPVGQLRGHGIAAMRSNRYRRFFEEHGYVVSLMSIRPRTMYYQGQFRHWNRTVKEDYWTPELQHIGQQEILNKELYAAHASPNGVFGYQDRYDEYRRQENSIGGEFRSSVLNYWHLAREFSSDPALNATFVKCVPSERTFAVPANDVMWVQANHNIQARRLVAQVGESFIF